MHVQTDKKRLELKCLNFDHDLCVHTRTSRRMVNSREMQAKCALRTSQNSREKKVCFADLVGLKLVFVKNITPASSEESICEACGEVQDSLDINGNILPKRRIIKSLAPCFVAPSRKDGFLERVHSQNVCLENIACENFIVAGLIRVENLSYFKEVAVRFTLDEWETFRDIRADYMSSCSDGKTDKFSFRIMVPIDFEVNRFMQFAIRYLVSNQEFWDNNSWNNYHVKCIEYSFASDL